MGITNVLQSDQFISMMPQKATKSISMHSKVEGGIHMEDIANRTNRYISKGIAFVVTL